MKKNELMNGDIVVLSSGTIAVVIGEGNDAYLLYQYGGFEFLDEYYDEDLYNEIDEDMVMQVFRSNGGFGFEGVDQEVPIWERDEAWECPTEHEREEQHRLAVERYEAECKAAAERRIEARKDLLFIVAQGFYGNRTGTEIRKEDIDRLLPGYHSADLPAEKPNEGNLIHLKEDIDRFILGYQTDEYPAEEPIDRSIIHLPGSDSLVLIYNKYQEAERLEIKERVFKEDNYVIKPLATIPELNLEIYSRCIVCRMIADGEFASLEDGDYEIWGRYLAN